MHRLFFLISFACFIPLLITRVFYFEQLNGTAAPILLSFVGFSFLAAAIVIKKDLDISIRSPWHPFSIFTGASCGMAALPLLGFEFDLLSGKSLGLKHVVFVLPFGICVLLGWYHLLFSSTEVLKKQDEARAIIWIPGVVLMVIAFCYWIFISN